MAISIEKQFGVHQYALQLRAERAGVIANNIANADTPGYKARDIDFKSMLNERMGVPTDSVSLATSNSVHLSTGMQQDSINGLKYRNPLQPSIDGNTVDSQREKTEFVSNNMGFQAAFQFLNGRVKSMLQAIKGE